MDDRVSDHAEVLVEWSARVEAGDDVVLSVGEGAHELAVAVVEALGVSQQTINAIERERYDPSFKLAFALARSNLGCRIEDLFEPE